MGLLLKVIIPKIMIVKKKYKISIQTGLHIGAGRDTFEIGEMDNPVVKDFETGIPYIPGSSLKGKIRFLLEKKYDKDKEKMALINNLFGVSANNKEEKEQERLTIIIVRDAFVSKETEEKIKQLQEQGLSITEEKYEVSLRDRRPNPRPLERVPKGYQFNLEVVFRFYEVADKEKQNQYLTLFKEGLDLLSEDYLGGSGSRGCGKVLIEEVVN